MKVKYKMNSEQKKCAYFIHDLYIERQKINKGIPEDLDTVINELYKKTGALKSSLIYDIDVYKNAVTLVNYIMNIGVLKK